MAIGPARQPWLTFGSRQLPVVRQATASECGLACVAMIAAYCGVATDLSFLRRQHAVSLKGATLSSIDHCCRNLGLSTRAVRCSIQELDQLQKPCILHWRFNHFVVLKSVTSNGIVIHDPARGVVSESMQTADDAFTGVALEISSATNVRQIKPPLRLKLANLVATNSGMQRKFAAGLLLALVCELLLLSTPFYLQLVIDQVLAKSDALLLNTLLLVFAVLLLFHIAANVIRQLTFQFLGHLTVFDISSRVFHRLLDLPVRFFRSRELGDIQHRVQSLSRVQMFIVQGIPALVLDSVFIVLIAAIMTLYDSQLTLLMFVTLTLWCLWRAAIFASSLRMSSDIAQAESAVQTHFLETLRVVQSIKVTNSEAHRQSEWQNLFAEVSNRRIQLGKLQIADSLVRQFLFQGTRIIAIYWLARKGLAAHMSIGTISAYVAYLGMFTTRCAGIVDRVMEYKLLEVPLNRLSDIVFSEAEPRSSTERQSRIGEVTLRDLSFSYANDEGAILRGCDAHMSEATLTVITGPSGCGKSTLLQIIAGNENPSSGELLLGGRPAHLTGLQCLRSQLAVVFQGDSLLKGSIAENIALFSSCIDMNRVRESTLAACVANDIEALPMAYETRIGDLGSSLSRGQVQRILLARAYYRQPKLLLLDEATSGLDSALERRVIASLSRFPATKIVVSHSDLMLQAADRVLWLHEGKLLSSRPIPAN